MANVTNAHSVKENMRWVAYSKINLSFLVHLITQVVEFDHRLLLYSKNLWSTANPGEGTAHSFDKNPILMVVARLLSQTFCFLIQLTHCFDAIRSQFK